MKTVLLLLALAAPALAQSDWGGSAVTPAEALVPLPKNDSAFRAAPAPVADLLWQGGVVGVFDEEAPDNFASLEARLHRAWHGLHPWTGLTLVDSGAWFAGAGVVYEFELSQHLRLTLGSGPFYYSQGHGDGPDLGLSLEFYSFAEVGWAGRHGTRLGARLGHLSNAGLGRQNPGTETLSLFMSVPLQLVAGRFSL